MNRQPQQIGTRNPRQLGKDRVVITPAKIESWFDDFEIYITTEVGDKSTLKDLQGRDRIFNVSKNKERLGVAWRFVSVEFDSIRLTVSDNRISMYKCIGSLHVATTLCRDFRRICLKALKKLLFVDQIMDGWTVICL